MPSCKEVATSISSGEYENLGWGGRLKFQFHLWMCKYCRAYVRQIQSLGEAARRLLRSDPPDSERLQRLEEELVERCSAKRQE